MTQKYAALHFTMFLFGAVLLGSCVETVDPHAARRVILSTGEEGKILAVNLDQSYVTLQTDHGKRLAYWDKLTEFYHRNERLQSHQPNVGEVWLFNGLESNREIYLRRVLVK